MSVAKEAGQRPAGRPRGGRGAGQKKSQQSQDPQAALVSDVQNVLGKNHADAKAFCATHGFDQAKISLALQKEIECKSQQQLGDSFHSPFAKHRASLRFFPSLLPRGRPGARSGTGLGGQRQMPVAGTCSGLWVGQAGAFGVC